MKIRLKAFGKLQSDLIDVPENTTPEFRLRLLKPLTAITGYSGEKIGEREEFETECLFEWTGKIEGDGRGARIYELTDIHKISVPK